MANWAWPHTPASNMARVVLADGPFAGEQIGFLPADTAAPAQIAWSSWFPWGFTSYLYEWRRETTTDRGRTDALLYRCTGRILSADEIPPLITEGAELWSLAAVTISEAYAVPAEVMWPGV